MENMENAMVGSTDLKTFNEIKKLSEESEMDNNKENEKIIGDDGLDNSL